MNRKPPQLDVFFFFLLVQQKTWQQHVHAEISEILYQNDISTRRYRLAFNTAIQAQTLYNPP